MKTKTDQQKEGFSEQQKNALIEEKLFGKDLKKLVYNYDEVSYDRIKNHDVNLVQNFHDHTICWTVLIPEINKKFDLGQKNKFHGLLGCVYWYGHHLPMDILYKLTPQKIVNAVVEVLGD